MARDGDCSDGQKYGSAAIGALFPSSERTLIGAHRGASAGAPENTFAAFDLAIAQGAELLELDVHSTADGVLVVHHDFDLTRTAGLATLIGAMTAGDLRVVDVGAWRGSQFIGELLPTFESVLDQYGRSVLLNVEIKVGEHPYRGIEARIDALIQRRGLQDRIVVSSFDLETIVRVRELNTHMRAALLYEAKPAQAPVAADIDHALATAMLTASEVGAVGVHLEHSLVNAAVMKVADSLGLGLLAWTVDAEAEMLRLAALGIDAIVSNDPALLRHVLSTTRAK